MTAAISTSRYDGSITAAQVCVCVSLKQTRWIRIMRTCWHLIMCKPRGEKRLMKGQTNGQVDNRPSQRWGENYWTSGEETYKLMKFSCALFLIENTHLPSLKAKINLHKASSVKCTNIYRKMYIFIYLKKSTKTITIYTFRIENIQ